MRVRATDRVFALAAITAAVVLFPTVASANMGPPAGLFVFGLRVVLVIEAVVIAVETPLVRHLLHLSWKRAFVAVLVSNLVSALVGLPVAFLSANSSGVSELLSRLDSTVIDALTGIVFFYVASVVIELPIVKWVARVSDWLESLRAVALANAVSHVVMLTLLVVLID